MLYSVTVIVTVTLLESAEPSVALYVNESAPLKFASGVYVNPPFAFRVSVPLVTSLTNTAVIVALSTSLSFDRTPGASTVRRVSSSVL